MMGQVSVFLLITLVCLPVLGSKKPGHDYDSRTLKLVQATKRKLESLNQQNLNSREILKSKLAVLQKLAQDIESGDPEDGAREHLNTCVSHLVSDSDYSRQGCEKKHNYLMVYAGLQDNYETTADCKKLPLYVKDSLQFLASLCGDSKFGTCY